MKTAQQATIHAVVPTGDYAPGGSKAAQFLTVGLAQSIRIEDNFGTKAENVIGSPLPIFHPGYLMTTISIEKATVDGYGFRNLGGFNPLWAHVGSTYRNENLIDLSTVKNPDFNTIVPDDGNGKMMPYMFILAVRDRISNSFVESYSPQIGSKGELATQKKTSNIIGSYVCVLTSANIGLQSSNAVIIDSVSCYARPLTGTWFSEAIREAFSTQRNGMDNLVNSVMFGYNSYNKPIDDAPARDRV